MILDTYSMIISIFCRVKEDIAIQYIDHRLYNCGLRPLALWFFATKAEMGWQLSQPVIVHFKKSASSSAATCSCFESLVGKFYAMNGRQNFGKVVMMKEQNERIPIVLKFIPSIIAMHIRHYTILLEIQIMEKKELLFI